MGSGAVPPARPVEALRDELVRLAADASPELLEFVVGVLRREVSARAWAAQVGPALTLADTARMLGRTPEQLVADPDLLGAPGPGGDLVFPVVLFDGSRPLPGLGPVLAVLRDAGSSPAALLAWLTGSQRSLAGARPVDVLRSGDVRARDRVLVAAHRYVAATAH